MRSPSRRCRRERKKGSMWIKVLGTECILDPGCVTFQFCRPLTRLPPEPSQSAGWVWGVAILLVDAKRPSQKTGPLPPDHPSSRLWKNPELETTQQRLCMWVCFHTSKSVRGTDVKMLDHTPRSSSQIERHRKLHHQLICPNVHSCLEAESEKAVALVQFGAKGRGCEYVTQLRQEWVKPPTDLIFSF